MAGFGFGQTMTHPRPYPIYEEDEEHSFLYNLLELVNKKLQITLRDGKTVIGYLRSVDQFTNLVLTETVERIFVGKAYGDLNLGMMIVRGDSLVVAGEFDNGKDEGILFRKVSGAEILNAQKRQEDESELREQKRADGFRQRGLQYIPRGHNLDRKFHLGEDLFRAEL